jgi:hypothetical protein
MRLLRRIAGRFVARAARCLVVLCLPILIVADARAQEASLPSTAADYTIGAAWVDDLDGVVTRHQIRVLTQNQLFHGCEAAARRNLLAAASVPGRYQQRTQERSGIAGPYCHHASKSGV